ncbi:MULTISPECIES: cytochrome C oxidase subunit IV family protein [Mycolicibacter]|uniref:cytochrome C oxidase subunit IV family protein n=1 Tax=Mycolicibacter TaxID=1073531 RepID=UPI0007EBA490|nr:MULTISPECIES: cytochrome C oxidase subunit IV family protein [Mycolicibacter]OBG33391.1 prokaryotic cytochrome C oxidase subunit IV family protein [Mycolicibacter heraklionensis]ULP46989.1 cytochrome C oxidase subunit IV family protein [Mycolicibacter virginiensis]
MTAPQHSRFVADPRLTGTWLVLVVITVLAWWLAPGHTSGHVEPSIPITVTVIALSAVKARLIIRNFMEVRTAPMWLRRTTDTWLAVLCTAVLVIYLF